MKLRVVVSLLAISSFFGVAARAQEYSKLDLFAGYSYVRANPSGDSGLASFNMNGGEASLAYNVNSWLSGVFDVGGYHASRDLMLACPFPFTTCPVTSGKGNTWTYLSGPRLSYRHLGRFTPFEQILFGVGHATPNVFLTSSQTHFAMTIGGGFDYRLTHRLSLRPIQADYLLTHFKESDIANRPTQNNLRLSTGLVFHF